MKHWNELTELESAIIRVNEFNNLFKLVVAGAENDMDPKVLQSAIYTLEGMIEDINSTLYGKFQTVWDCIKYDAFSTDAMQEAKLAREYENTMHFTPEYQGSTVQINSTSEEDEAFKELEKAIKNWHKLKP